MISGLKNSLEERAYLNGFEDEVIENGERRNLSEVKSNTIVSDEKDKHITSPSSGTLVSYSNAAVSISRSKLSAEKLKELKEDLSDRDYNLKKLSIETVFEFAGYLLVSLVGILSGLILINWWSPNSIPEAIDRFTNLIN